MSSNIDDQLFAWIKSTLGGVSDITDIVVANKIVRDDYSESQMGSPPRIEYNPYRFSVTEANTVYTGQFGITVVCDRAAGSTYGGGDTPETEGNAWTLESLVISTLANVRPTITGYQFSKIEYQTRRRPTETPDTQVDRRLNFKIVSYPGATDIPLSGGDSSLSGLDASLTVTGYNISVNSTVHTEMATSTDTIDPVRLNKPTARVQIRVRLGGDGSHLYPAVGSRIDLAYGTDADSTFTTETLIQSVQFVPNYSEVAAPQNAIINGVIDDPASPVFTGIIP